jgi:hypothetical protein
LATSATGGYHAIELRKNKKKDVSTNKKCYYSTTGRVCVREDIALKGTAKCAFAPVKVKVKVVPRSRRKKAA